MEGQELLGEKYPKVCQAKNALFLLSALRHIWPNFSAPQKESIQEPGCTGFIAEHLRDKLPPKSLYFQNLAKDKKKKLTRFPNIFPKVYHKCSVVQNAPFRGHYNMKPTQTMHHISIRVPSLTCTIHFHQGCMPPQNGSHQGLAP